jgi:hypothetical protein
MLPQLNDPTLQRFAQPSPKTPYNPLGSAGMSSPTAIVPKNTGGGIGRAEPGPLSIPTATGPMSVPHYMQNSIPKPSSPQPSRYVPPDKYPAPAPAAAPRVGKLTAKVKPTKTSLSKKSAVPPFRSLGSHPALSRMIGR